MNPVHLGQLLYLSVCFCHVMYVPQSESTLYSCLTVKELLAWSRRKMWKLSGCNWTLTQNNLVCKRILNHLAKWLSVCLRTKWPWVRVQLQLLYLSFELHTKSRFLKLLYNQVLSGSVIAPFAGLKVWWWCSIFNGSGNFITWGFHEEAS